MKINEAIFEYDGRLGQVKEYVEQNLSKPLPVRAVASVVGLNPKYFSTFFHQHVGVCYREWLAYLRIQRARRRFREANYPITRVAFSVGFGSVRAFERAFKRHTSMTPRDYKKMVRPELTAEDTGPERRP